METKANTMPPPLPIPPLEQTMTRFLERVRPLVDPAEYTATEQTVQRFLIGSGPRLQNALIDFSKSIAPGNWLAVITEDLYLTSRDEINGTVNYLTTLDMAKLPKYGSIAQLSAALVHAMTSVYVQSVNGSLPLDSGRMGPLCMSQYQYIFGTCRIPRFWRDELFIGKKQAANAHIVVLRGENIYTLSVTDSDGRLLGASSLAEGITQILASNDLPEPNVGAMTAANRNTAAKLHIKLCELDAHNRKNFAQIYNALFALCLDEPAHRRSAEQVAFDGLHGYGKNRWFDKCIQVIVGNDYTVGFNNEHTAFDAATWINVMLNIYDQMSAGHDFAMEGKKPDVRRLTWVTDESVLADIRTMEEADKVRGENLCLRVVSSDFGANAIKKIKESPDTFFQLAMQLAWFRRNGRVNSTYESVSVRHFRGGRTEGMRVSTWEAMEFVTAMQERPDDRDELIRLAKAAFDRQKVMIAQCQEAQGVERHTSGLHAMMRVFDEPVPPEEDVLNSNAYKILRRDTLSTSGLTPAARCMELFAFGPVVENGFGMGYIVDADTIRMGVSCFKVNEAGLDPFVKEVKRAMYDLLQLLEG